MDVALPCNAQYDYLVKTISNFPVFLHNCDAIGDFHCIQIYKDLIHILSTIGWKIEGRVLSGLDECGKRAYLEGVIRYLSCEEVIRIDGRSGKLILSEDSGSN
jgi:hypothetical protein